METRSRASRFAVTVAPERLDTLDAQRAAWYESPEEIQAGLAWGREKARVLKWLRARIRACLAPAQRRYLELYFFGGMSYRQVAACTGVNPAVVHRSVRSAVRHLQREAEADGVCLRLRASSVLHSHGSRRVRGREGQTGHRQG